MKGAKADPVQCIWVLLLILPGSTNRAAAASAHPQATYQRIPVTEQPNILAPTAPDALYSGGTLQVSPQQSQLGVRLSVPDQVLAKGYKGLAPATLRNWRRLAEKLRTPGSTVSIASFGGSITAGYIDESPYISYVDALLAWFKGAYPGITFTLLNLARSGVDVIPASTCWYQYVPQDVDLVTIEYSVNGCSNNMQCHSFASPRVASYETLIRRLIRRAPGAALLSVAAFNFLTVDVPVLDAQGVNITVQMRNPFYGSGEDHHTRIAQHYGVPMASIRDALYDIIYDDSALLATVGLTRRQLLSSVHPVHPTTAGHILYAKIILYTIRLTLTNALRATPGSGGSAQPQQQQQQLALPSPISPIAAEEADGDPFCAESGAFQQYASKVNGWSWVPTGIKYACPHSNCNSYGFYAAGLGNTLEITVDTTEDAPGLSSGSLDRKYLAVLFTVGHLADWASRMARARLACVSGCACNPVLLARPEPTNLGGNLALANTEVTPHPSCVVSVTIVGNSSNPAGEEFIVNGIAVVPFTKSKALSPIDRLAIRAVMR